MAWDTERGALFRAIVPHQHSSVTYAELLFDLVFVFAVTQVSHALLANFTPLGAVQTTLLLLSVWWVWVYTSWITNWLNPELTPVRVLLFLLMLGGLVLSTSIPKAFDSRGLWFASAYAAMQVGRTVFWLISTPRARTLARMNAVRILVWLSTSAIFWIAGGFAQGHARLVLWALALAIEYVSPAVRFWIPKYGASSVADWYVEGGHMAERCAGFIIIALGESIVVTGATFADLTWTSEVVGAFLSAFIGALAMWWIYFHKGAEAGSETDLKFERAGAAGAARLHLPASADRRRHHSFRRRRRPRAPASRRPFRSENRAERRRRAAIVSDRHHPLQALYSRLAAALPRCRHRRAWRALVVCRRFFAVDAVDRDHGADGRRRGLGIDLAAVSGDESSLRSHQHVNREHAARVGPGFQRRPA